MQPSTSEGLSRRRFLHLAAAGAAALAAGGGAAVSSCDNPTTGPDTGERRRLPLAMPGTISIATASLVAAPATASVAGNAPAAVWLFSGHLPGPTIRARTGEYAHIRLLNQLPEPTVVHWHGVLVPAPQDGHPRYAIGPGATFDYEFPIVQRAGTFWYHPHAHHLTAGQIQRGLAGFFIITDEEEDALGLPTGPREILLLLQDRDGNAAEAFSYAPTADDLRTGILRDLPYGNGVRLPTLQVSGQRYRFRVLNASHARVYLLALSNGVPLTVIGNDGGLLPSATEVESVFLGVGERIDFLIDLAAFPTGTRMMLKSLPFSLPSASDGLYPQGLEMDLLELVRTGGGGSNDPSLPAVLSSVPHLTPAAERSFVFRSTDQENMHQINGRSFEMDRVDEQIPLGQVEQWVFSNDSTLPHPVHLHGTHFQVLSRSGRRNQVFPYEAGWKDTVLLMPLETVRVAVRFDRYPGIFLLHCHNLQHEDMGMMLNVEVI
jgi:FtsP/CotA-like multicopper oxidase with cupredoxin domain